MKINITGGRKMNEKETALKEGRKVYQVITEVCSKCGRLAPWRYVHSDECETCCNLRANDLYHLAALIHDLQGNIIKKYPIRPGMKAPDRHIDDEEVELINRCLKMAGQDLSNSQTAAITREQAISRNIPVYITLFPCKQGHTGLRTIAGKCYFCQTESPRQSAMKSGKDWYDPIEHCSKCGKLAPRRVSNGQCSGCVPSTSTQQPTSTQWIADHPDMILDRALARTLGIKVYRTGKPCRHGKTGWKWVSTGNCVNCK
jgi:hypothetical protein